MNRGISNIFNCISCCVYFTYVTMFPRDHLVYTDSLHSLFQLHGTLLCGGTIVYSVNPLLKKISQFFTTTNSAVIKSFVHMSFHIFASISLAQILRSKIARLRNKCLCTFARKILPKFLSIEIVPVYICTRNVSVTDSSQPCQ